MRPLSLFYFMPSSAYPPTRPPYAVFSMPSSTRPPIYSTYLGLPEALGAEGPAGRLLPHRHLVRLRRRRRAPQGVHPDAHGEVLFLNQGKPRKAKNARGKEGQQMEDLCSGRKEEVLGLFGCAWKWCGAYGQCARRKAVRRARGISRDD